MNKALICIVCVWVFSTAMTASAEPVYVTDKFSVGLHEDKTADSPIIKVVTSGTRLELVKQENNLSFVSEAGGATGWVDNTYLNNAMPASEQLRQLTARNATLEAQLRDLRSGTGGTTQAATTNSQSAGDIETLQGQYNSEKLKVGELQVTISELRKRLGSSGDADKLYDEIEALRELNKDLEIQLANTLDGASPPATSSAMASVTSAIEAGKLSIGWKTITATVLVLLVLGLCGGVYLMDVLNRRRHGGFRI